MASQTYENLDLSYPSTVQGMATMLVGNKTQYCPFHKKQRKEKENKKKNPKKFKFGILTSVFRKSSLQKKLKFHGLKINLKKVKKYKILPSTDEDEEDSNKFTRSELSLLSITQLRLIVETFQSRIKELSQEYKELNEENKRHNEDTEGLKLTLRNLEELSLRTLKPWVNKMPNSDELTRVMLLNWYLLNQAVW